MEQPHTSSKHSLILLIVGAGLVLVAAASFAFIARTPPAAETSAVPLVVNFPAKDVRLKDLDGHPVAFSDHSGQVILYNAWATWCPPCKAELPVLEAYYRAHRQEGFVVIAVEDGEPPAVVSAFVRQAGLTFPVWPDTRWVATNTYAISDLPSSYVIDRGFNVRLMWLGPITLEKLEQYVTPLLKSG